MLATAEARLAKKDAVITESSHEYFTRSTPEREYMRRQYFDGDTVPPGIRHRLRKAFANMYFTSASYFIRGGDRASGRRMVWRAVWSDSGRALRMRQVRRIVYCLLGGRNRRAGAT